MKVSLPNQHTYHAFIIQAAAVAVAAFVKSQGGKRRAVTLRGKIAQKCVHNPVADIYSCLRQIYFCRTYRMSYSSFWHLHDLLEVLIDDIAAKVRGYSPKGVNGERPYSSPLIPNGIISSSVRLAIALRYFSGGSPYDIMVKYGVSHTSIFESVWMVVEAVNESVIMKITYLSDAEVQKNIARGFCDAS
jgi:hypothetical protein